MKKVLGLDSLKPESLNGKKVFVRVDFNVPVEEGKISDITRLKASLPTIKYLEKNKAIIILASHFGRPKGKPNPEYSLKIVAEELERILGKKVLFIPDCIGEKAKSAINGLEAGSICLLENVRFYAEEEKNDPDFSKKLADLADIYVNDAFGSAHRAHASTAGITQYLKTAVAGFLMEKEVKELSSVLHSPERPFTSIIGGSKISSKLEILNSLIEKSDVVLIGGGMAYTLIKAQGGKIGKSICENDKLSMALEIIEKAKRLGTALVLPDDNLCIEDFDNKNEEPQAFLTGQIPDSMSGCDIGPITCDNFEVYIGQSKTVLWNGPVGIFEDHRFACGSRVVAKALVKLQAQGGKTIIGGGDSASAINAFGFTEKDFGHISTGGGASLEFLEGKTLPGIAALNCE